MCSSDLKNKFTEYLSNSKHHYTVSVYGIYIILHLSARYLECGIKTISAFVKNPLTSGEWENLPAPSVRTESITVVCPLSGLEVETTPLYSSARRLELSAGSEIELKVTLKNGSNPRFIYHYMLRYVANMASFFNQFVFTVHQYERKTENKVFYCLEVNKYVLEVRCFSITTWFFLSTFQTVLNLC